MFSYRSAVRTYAVAAAAASLFAATPALAVITPGTGVTVVPLASYDASVSGPTNSDAGFNQTHLAFDGTGSSSFQLTSLASVGDSVTFSGLFLIDEDAAKWDIAGAGAHRSRLFLQAGVGAPLAAPLPGGAQRDNPNQTPGVTMEYNTSGTNDNSNYDYLLDNVNQFNTYSFGNTTTADFDQSNGAGADTQIAGGLATISTKIVRTLAGFDWLSTIDYRYVDDPNTVIATATATGALILPGSVASTYFTPFNQLGIGDTTGPWAESISDSKLTFDIAVPEPTGVALIAMGAGALLLRRRRSA